MARTKGGSTISSAAPMANAGKQYTSIDKLTPELLRLFKRIEIGERSEKGSRHASQSIRMIYRDIGTLSSPMLPGEAESHIIPAIPMDNIRKMTA